MTDNPGYRAYGASGNVGWNVGQARALGDEPLISLSKSTEYGGWVIRHTARGRSEQGPPRAADRGAHPFWPGDRAPHGTGSTAVVSGKNLLNLK